MCCVNGDGGVAVRHLFSGSRGLSKCISVADAAYYGPLHGIAMYVCIGSQRAYNLDFTAARRDKVTYGEHLPEAAQK